MWEKNFQNFMYTISTIILLQNTIRIVNDKKNKISTESLSNDPISPILFLSVISNWSFQMKGFVAEEETSTSMYL